LAPRADFAIPSASNNAATVRTTTINRLICSLRPFFVQAWALAAASPPLLSPGARTGCSRVASDITVLHSASIIHGPIC
jgi:hypothetical protein